MNVENVYLVFETMIRPSFIAWTCSEYLAIQYINLNSSKDREFFYLHETIELGPNEGIDEELFNLLKQLDKSLYCFWVPDDSENIYEYELTYQTTKDETEFIIDTVYQIGRIHHYAYINSNKYMNDYVRNMIQLYTIVGICVRGEEFKDLLHYIKFPFKIAMTYKKHMDALLTVNEDSTYDKVWLDEFDKNMIDPIALYLYKKNECDDDINIL